MQETNKLNKNVGNELHRDCETTRASEDDKNRKSSSKQNNEQNEDFPVPENTRILEHQIAGHQHGQGRTKVGLLKHNDGNILKPMIKNDPRGIRELEFYKKVFHNCNNTEVSFLQSFLPRFKGTWETTINGNEIKYLCIDDVTEAFIKPCILDIKIGPCTYDPEASPEKILQETIKYPTSTITGFRILGMRIFCHSTGGFLYLDKHYGRRQTPETIADALFLYLNKSYDFAAAAVLCGFLHKLRAVENWFKVQRSFAFYSSSLLFVYEGDRTARDRWNRQTDAPENAASREEEASRERVPGRCSACGLSSETCRRILRRNENPSEAGLSVLFDVRMIDFAHVFPSDRPDQNYLFGLKRLIGYLEVLRVRIRGR